MQSWFMAHWPDPFAERTSVIVASSKQRDTSTLQNRCASASNSRENLLNEVTATSRSGLGMLGLATHHGTKLPHILSSPAWTWGSTCRRQVFLACLPGINAAKFGDLILRPAMHDQTDVLGWSYRAAKSEFVGIRRAL